MATIYDHLFLFVTIANCLEDGISFFFVWCSTKVRNCLGLHLFVQPWFTSAVRNSLLNVSNFTTRLSKVTLVWFSFVILPFLILSSGCVFSFIRPNPCVTVFWVQPAWSTLIIPSIQPERKRWQMHLIYSFLFCSWIVVEMTHPCFIHNSYSRRVFSAHFMVEWNKFVSVSSETALRKKMLCWNGWFLHLCIFAGISKCRQRRLLSMNPV